MEWISTKEDLPNADDLEGELGEYYFIKMEGWGTAKALFLQDVNGECGWYINYIAKIIRPVTHWMKPED